MQKYHYMYARDVAVIKMAARVVSVHTAMPYARTADGYLNPGTHCGILNDFYKNYHIFFRSHLKYQNVYQGSNNCWGMGVRNGSVSRNYLCSHFNDGNISCIQ